MRQVGSQKLIYNHNGKIIERRYRAVRISIFVTVLPIVSVFRRYNITLPIDSIVGKTLTFLSVTHFHVKFNKFEWSMVRNETICSTESTECDVTILCVTFRRQRAHYTS
jgi:hypothetical protein